MSKAGFRLLRYPGGKQRLIEQLIQDLPSPLHITGKFIEPFVGGGAVFFALNPQRAILADVNQELIDLYRGIRRNAVEVWDTFSKFPSTKKAYYKIRNSEPTYDTLTGRAARTLYLNRTCFKGMWRHNANGQFNVGYGGQDRRWVVTQPDILEVAKRLRRARLRAADFEEIVDACNEDDFLFLDPPYRPGEREMTHSHYVCSNFTFDDQKRLAAGLQRASRRGARWAMTTSSHADILRLFRGNRVIRLTKGTGRKPGIMTKDSGEVLICNYRKTDWQ